MAEYNYKGYTAEITETRIGETWFTTFPEPPRFLVELESDFCSYKSNPLDGKDVKLVRNMYIKYFEMAVDKHNRALK